MTFGWLIKLACHRPPKVLGTKGGLWAACGLARGPAERNSVPGIVRLSLDCRLRLDAMLEIFITSPINTHLQQPRSSPSTSLTPRSCYICSIIFVCRPFDKSTLQCWRASFRQQRVSLLAWLNPPPPPPPVLLHPGKSISHAHRGSRRASQILMPSTLPCLCDNRAPRLNMLGAFAATFRRRAILPAQMYFYGQICAIPSHFGRMSRTVRSSHTNTITSNSNLLPAISTALLRDATAPRSCRTSTSSAAVNNES